MADNFDLLRDLEAKAEAAYDSMYDAETPRGAAGCYSDAKDAYSEAIGLAQRLGAEGDVARLVARFAHVQAVYRSQFA